MNLSAVPLRTWTRLVASSTLLLFAAVVLYPLWLFDVYPSTHETERYAVLTWHFGDALRHGSLYPRWLPDLAGGYGYPTFCFYQPLFFYFSAGLWLLGCTPASGVMGAVIMTMGIGIAGAYRLARQFGDRMFSVGCAVLYFVTPYLFVNAYVRGDFSELLSMVWLPWSVYFLYRIAKGTVAGKRTFCSICLLSVSLALIPCSHPVTGLVFFAAFPFLVAALVWEHSSHWQRIIVRSAIPYVGSIFLSSIYWISVFQLRPYVQLERATVDYCIAWRHLVAWWQLIHPAWGFGPSSVDDTLDGMSFQLGLPHLLFSLAGVIGGWKLKSCRMYLLVYLGLMSMITVWSLPIWYYVNALALIQFPWRILAVVATLQLLLMAHLGSRVNSNRSRWIGLTAIVMTVWFHWSMIFPFHGSKTSERVADVVKQLVSASLVHPQLYANVNEFGPRTASLPQEGARQRQPLLIVDSSLGEGRMVAGHSHHHLRYQVSLRSAGTVMINQFHFPGWRVRRNGVDVPPQELAEMLTKDGRMQVKLPAGETLIEAKYAGPPHRFWRMLIWFVGTAVCGLLAARYSRK
jgi:hypothetical protein